MKLKKDIRNQQDGELSDDMINEAGRPYGELIREYRRRKHMSQEQLGAIAGVKKNAVGAWEAGRSRPDVASIPALCEELGIPLHVFFGIPEEGRTNEVSDRFERLNDYNRKVILRQMEMLYSLQEAEEPAAPDEPPEEKPLSYQGE